MKGMTHTGLLFSQPLPQKMDQASMNASEEDRTT